MHRTTADGHVIENGKRRFEDQDLPLKPGTADTAGYNNAVQEELANIVELTGGTLAADETADRAAGWRQVYDAIFAGQNIDTAALKDGAVTAAKIAVLGDTVAWHGTVGPQTRDLAISPLGTLKSRRYGYGVDTGATVSGSGVEALEPPAESGIPEPFYRTKIQPRGITFGGTANITENGSPFALATFVVANPALPLVGRPQDSSGDYIGYGVGSMGDVITLPFAYTTLILGAWLAFTDTNGRKVVTPCTFNITAGPGTTCTTSGFQTITGDQEQPDVTKPIRVTVLYDGSTI